ncbi:MAG: hypothetical protein IPM48_06005 [Saprospiraceae bacterium]|nr:hypothetical protein [Saprospiraceae bacterium]
MANVIWRTQLNTHPDYPKTKTPYSIYFTVNEKGRAEICAEMGETVTWPVISNRKKYSYATLVDSWGKIISEYRIDADKMLRDSLDSKSAGNSILQYLTGSFDQSGKTIWLICRVGAYTEIVVFGLATIGNVDFIKTPKFSIQSSYSKI